MSIIQRLTIQKFGFYGVWTEKLSVKSRCLLFGSINYGDFTLNKNELRLNENYRMITQQLLQKNAEDNRLISKWEMQLEFLQ